LCGGSRGDVEGSAGTDCDALVTLGDSEGIVVVRGDEVDILRIS